MKHIEQLIGFGCGLAGGPVYYPGGGPWMMGVDMAEAGSMAPTTAAATTTAGAMAGYQGTNGYSGTNVQVAGVDEPDTVKTDGERILTIISGTLYYVEVDGASARLAGKSCRTGTPRPSRAATPAMNAASPPSTS